MKKLAFSLIVLTGLASGAAQAAAPKAAAGKSDTPTCGQMVSGMAAIPAKLATGAEAVAEVWEAHATLMGKDKDSQTEVKGLHALAKSHKQLAAHLKKESEDMKKAAGWPDAPHDMAKMTSDPKLTAATQKLIEAHKEIIALMQKSLADLEAMTKPKK
jgi:hypothetical protein